MPDTCVIVPCYNEAERLPRAQFIELSARPGVRVLFVDDGSRDATADVLAELAEETDRISWFSLPANAGKAEAVRAGMQRAMASGVPFLGYIDADMATPLDQVQRLIERVRESDAAAVLGSRVALAGHHIRRTPSRHYLGRLFATVASSVLHATIYDTQCGAKFFLATPQLAAAVEEPFQSRWAFDIELLGRLLVGRSDVAPVEPDEIIEIPLAEWNHVDGSKLKPSAMIKAATDLARISADLRRRRRRRDRP